MWESLGAWMSWSVTRVRSGVRVTEPSTMTSTLSSRPIEGMSIVVSS